MQISYQKGNGYLFVSRENMSIYTYGKAWETDLTGIGIGIEREIFKYINLFAQAGYYIVENNLPRTRGMNEGGLYYLNNMYALWNNNQYVSFDEYEVKQKNTLGITFGGEMVYPVAKNFNVGLSVAYRAMKIQESIAGYNDEWADDPGHWWEFSLNRNYDAIVSAFTISYVW